MRKLTLWALSFTTLLVVSAQHLPVPVTAEAQPQQNLFPQNTGSQIQQGLNQSIDTQNSINNNMNNFQPTTQRDTVRLVYSISSLLGFVLGISLNALLLWLIQTKTVSAMRIYSRLLMQSCVMDILIALATVIVQPIPVVDHGYRMVFLNGIFRDAAQPIRYACYLIWIQLMLFFLVSTTTQFIFRYFLLTGNGHIPTRILWFMLAVAVSLNIMHVALLTWADYPRVEDADKMIEMQAVVFQEAGITELSFFSFVYARSFRWLCHVAVMVVLFTSCYSIIVVCSLKIRHYVNSMNKLRLQSYNNQVSKALLFQSLLPTLEVASITLQIVLPMLFDSQTIFVVIYTVVPLYFVPALNATGTILLVGPYRRAVLGFVTNNRVGATTTIVTTGIGGGGVTKTGVPSIREDTKMVFEGNNVEEVNQTTNGVHDSITIDKNNHLNGTVDKDKHMGKQGNAVTFENEESSQPYQQNNNGNLIRNEEEQSNIGPPVAEFSKME